MPHPLRELQGLVIFVDSELLHTKGCHRADLYIEDKHKMTVRQPATGVLKQ
jgi:hypothetical protein